MRYTLLFLFLLTACGMSRQEQIQALKECEDAGLEAEIIHNGMDYSIARINCLPTPQTVAKK